MSLVEIRNTLRTELVRLNNLASDLLARPEKFYGETDKEWDSIDFARYEIQRALDALKIIETVLKTIK